MSTPLAHSPAAILRQLLLDLGLATASGAWPVYASNEPDAPDDCVTVYDTAGTVDGRSMIDGEVYGHYGLQVRVRGAAYPDAWAKAAEVAQALSESVALAAVAVGDAAYLVTALARFGDVLALGKESRTSKRSVFTLNLLASIDPL